MSKTNQAILDALQGSNPEAPVTLNDLHEMTGIRKSTLTRQAQKLAEEGQIYAFHIYIEDDEENGEYVKAACLPPQEAEDAEGEEQEAEDAEGEEQEPAPAPAPVEGKMKKWERTAQMAEDGTTVEQVSNVLGISKVAARSQIQDLRRRGYTLNYEGGWYYAHKA